MTLSPGALVVEVSGRPVFFLPGRLPAYRNLAVSDFGPDVLQLNSALHGAGYLNGSPGAAYDARTAAAVTAMYRSHGYTPEIGGSLPMSAVDYLDGDQATVVVQNATLGQDALKADLELAGGDLKVIVQLTTADTPFLKLGTQVSLTDELINKTAVGKIDELVPAQGTSGPEAVVAPASALTSDWAGQDVRVTVATAAGTALVMAVPISAVSLNGNGATKVVVLAGKAQRDVLVTVGATGAGYAQITPQQPGTIAVGDQVVVGEK